MDCLWYIQIPGCTHKINVAIRKEERRYRALPAKPDVSLLLASNTLLAYVQSEPQNVHIYILRKLQWYPCLCIHRNMHVSNFFYGINTEVRIHERIP